MVQYKAICSLNCLPQIRKFVREELIKLEVSENLTNQLVLAVDEACANSIIHQHQNDGKSEFDLVLNRVGGQLVIEIRDTGIPFPIDKYQPEEIGVILQRGTPGGLGIKLITEIMDKVEVEMNHGKFTYRFIKMC